MFNIRQKILSLVSQDKLEEALNELDKYSEKINSLHKDQIVLVKGNLKDIKKRSTLRVLSSEEEQLFLNRIRLSILQILDSVDKLKMEDIEQTVSISNINQFKNEALIKKHSYYTYNTIIKIVNGITYVLGKIISIAPFVLIIGVPYYFFNKHFVTKKLINSKIEVLLDKNELDKAQSVIDSLVTIDAYFDRSDFQYKILDKKIEQEIDKKNIENAKKVLLSSDNYFNFKKEDMSNLLFHEYNINVHWFNNNLMKIAIAMCNNQEKLLAIGLIEKESKPNLIMSANGFEVNFDKKNEIIEKLNKY